MKETLRTIKESLEKVSPLPLDGVGAKGDYMEVYKVLAEAADGIIPLVRELEAQMTRKATELARDLEFLASRQRSGEVTIPNAMELAFVIGEQLDKVSIEQLAPSVVALRVLLPRIVDELGRIVEKV